MSRVNKYAGTHNMKDVIQFAMHDIVELEHEKEDYVATHSFSNDYVKQIQIELNLYKIESQGYLKGGYK